MCSHEPATSTIRGIWSASMVTAAPLTLHPFRDLESGGMFLFRYLPTWLFEKWPNRQISLQMIMIYPEKNAFFFVQGTKTSSFLVLHCSFGSLLSCQFIANASWNWSRNWVLSRVNYLPTCAAFRPILWCMANKIVQNEQGWEIWGCLIKLMLRIMVIM